MSRQHWHKIWLAWTVEAITVKDEEQEGTVIELEQSNEAIKNTIHQLVWVASRQ